MVSQLDSAMSPADSLDKKGWVRNQDSLTESIDSPSRLMNMSLAFWLISLSHLDSSHSVSVELGKFYYGYGHISPISTYILIPMESYHQEECLVCTRVPSWFHWVNLVSTCFSVYLDDIFHNCPERSSFSCNVFLAHGVHFQFPSELL